MTMDPAELDPFSEDHPSLGPDGAPKNPHPLADQDGTLPEHLRPDPDAEGANYGFSGPQVLGSWTFALREFERNLWPVFKRQGYSKDAALQAALLNNLLNSLPPVINITINTGGDGDGEEWTPDNPE